jgi:branched-chain amino acid transport system substrate-binding protein
MFRGWSATLATLTALGAMVAAGCGDSNTGDNASGAAQTSSPSTTSSAPAKDPNAGKPYRILMLTSLSGPAGIYGAGELQGAKAAQKALNDQGGINGRQVDLNVKDFGSDPAKAVTLLQKEITGGHKPDFVIAGINASDALAIAPAANAAKIISWSAAPAPDLGDPKKSPYTFLINPSYNDVGRGAARAIAAAGYKRAATLTQNDDPGKSNSAGFKEVFEQLGGKVVAEELYTPFANDVTGPFERAYAKKPDVIYLPFEGTIAVFRAHRAAGSSIPMYCDIGCTNDYVKTFGADTMANTYAFALPLQTRQPEERTDRQKQFIAALDAVGGDKGQGLILPAIAYDPIMVTAQAAKQAGSTDTVAVTKALESLTGDTTWAQGIQNHFTPTSHFSLQTEDKFPFVPFSFKAPYRDGVFDISAT